MNRRLFLFLTIFLLHFVVQAQEPVFLTDDWQNAAIFEKGQNAPHVFHVPFSGWQAALNNDAAGCENLQLLNGMWKFKWVETPGQVPEGFWEPDFDVAL